MIRQSILLISLGGALALPASAQAPAAAPAAAADPFAKMHFDSAGDPADRLAGYLRTLSNSPRDVAALIGAGRAALDVGDANAAVGFFARADSLSPKTGTIKAGLATALLRMDKPREASRLFDTAVDLGVPEAQVASDRGLAWDLRGEQKRAQKDYRIALAAGENAEVTRRLALSLGISGDRAGAIQLLTPLLYKNDAAAWRARAFVLAMTGDVPGAAAIASSVMMPAQAAAMQPFFARLASLDPADKARAVHFGEMPSDGTSYSAAELAGMGAAPAASYRPETAPANPAAAANSRRARAAAALQLRNKAADDNAPPIPPPLAERASRERAAEAEAEASAAEQRAEKERQAAEARAKKVEPNPSRIWVQVASGANRKDMPRAWNSVKAKNASALKGRSPALARAGATNRLLVGPFKTEKEARAVVNKVSGSFTFTSSKGEEITTLAGAKIQVKAPVESRKAAPARKSSSSKATTARKGTAKKATARKAPAKKTTAKKAPAKKSTASKKAAPKKKKK